MDTDNENQADDTEQLEAAEVEETEAEVTETDDSQEADAGTEVSADDEGEQLVIKVDGEDSPPQQDTGLVKHLRGTIKGKSDQIKELKSQLKAAQPTAQIPVTLGKEPELEDEGIDFDQQKYAQALRDHFKQERQIEETQAAEQSQHDAQNADWQQRLDAHNTAAVKLNAPDYADADATAQQYLTPNQQHLIVRYAKESPLVVYAIGTNPATAAKLSAIKDEGEFILAIRDLESNMTVTKQRKAPAPESTIRASNGGGSGGAEKQLKKLRAEAAETGDFTAVKQFRAKQKTAARQSQ